MQLAGKLLFEDIDVDQSGGADWMEFVNFVCAIAETLRIQAEEGTGITEDPRLAYKTLLKTSLTHP